jgi:hypothetical protein
VGVLNGFLSRRSCVSIYKPGRSHYEQLIQTLFAPVVHLKTKATLDRGRGRFQNRNREKLDGSTVQESASAFP